MDQKGLIYESFKSARLETGNSRGYGRPHCWDYQQKLVVAGRHGCLVNHRSFHSFCLPDYLTN